ncbi:MAG: hypothetical protein J07HX64_02367 [halophilic archaeon J07HX64]|nr:MAG: hypothetical protein J07HX64_02367 [halophilic archaeon J07HX64]
MITVTETLHNIHEIAPPETECVDPYRPSYKTLLGRCVPSAVRE